MTISVEQFLIQFLIQYSDYEVLFPNKHNDPNALITNWNNYVNQNYEYNFYVTTHNQRQSFILQFFEVRDSCIPEYQAYKRLVNPELSNQKSFIMEECNIEHFGISKPPFNTFYDAISWLYFNKNLYVNEDEKDFSVWWEEMIKRELYLSISYNRAKEWRQENKVKEAVSLLDMFDRRIKKQKFMEEN